ncbi:MAG TPA: DUF4245 family protein [Marmoricola sp.]|nr:DUF4245 family protein [Marmoricola sp.]
MSQPTTARPPRTVSGMVGALVVVVALVVGVVLFRQSGQEPAQTPSVDWSAWVRSGRSEQQLMVFAPTSLPKGWRATSVTYAGGTGAHWHLGMLTDTRKYVGIEESRDPTRDLVEQYVDETAVAGKDVTVAGETWHTWTDAGGDYALVRSIEVAGAPYESVLVVGSAPAAVIRSFAATLTSGTVKTAG